MPKLSSSQIAAIRAYTGTAYRTMNRYLREGGRVERKTLDYIAEIDRALSDNPAPARIIVYRGVSETYADELAGNGLAIGDIIRDKGYLSTSRRKDVAEGFMSGDEGLLFVVQIDPGALALDVSAFSDYPHEAETLLTRDAPLRVVGYDSAEDALILEFAENE
jgi:hypothetical protein